MASEEEVKGLRVTELSNDNIEVSISYDEKKNDWFWQVNGRTRREKSLVEARAKVKNMTAGNTTTKLKEFEIYLLHNVPYWANQAGEMDEKKVMKTGQIVGLTEEVDGKFRAVEVRWKEGDSKNRTRDAFNLKANERDRMLVFKTKKNEEKVRELAKRWTSELADEVIELYRVDCEKCGHGFGNHSVNGVVCGDCEGQMEIIRKNKYKCDGFCEDTFQSAIEEIREEER